MSAIVEAPTRVTVQMDFVPEGSRPATGWRNEVKRPDEP